MTEYGGFEMVLSFEVFLIVCPLVFLAGLVDAIAGGGGLISLPAYLIAGIPPHFAIGTNKLSSAVGTTVSAARYIKNKFVDWPIAIPCVVLALIGSSLGANLVLLIDESIIRYMLVGLLPFIAIYLLWGKKAQVPEEKKNLPRKNVVIIACIASFIIGTYDGFYGPGTGSFLILVYTAFAKMDIRIASGNTKLVNLASNISALVTFILHGKIIFLLGITAAVFSIAGHYIGAGLVIKNGYKIVRPVILVVLGLLLLKVILGN